MEFVGTVEWKAGTTGTSVMSVGIYCRYQSCRRQYSVFSCEEWKRKKRKKASKRMRKAEVEFDEDCGRKGDGVKKIGVKYRVNSMPS
jgi:hypothetical protein